MPAINPVRQLNITPRNSVYKTSGRQPSFSGRLIPTKISYRYENMVFKTILAPIMNWKARHFQGIRKSLAPLLQKVSISGKKGGLYAWESNPGNSEKYVLFLHGMKGKNPAPPNQTLIETVLKKGGYGIITPEYRGTAEISRHPFTFNSMTEDSEATLEYLYSKGIKPENITILAHCIGSIPTATIASKWKNIGKIILVSPVSNGEEYGTSFFRTLNLKAPKFIEKGFNKLISLFMPYDMTITKIIQGVDAPTTIIMPEHDKLISISQAKKLGQNIKNLKDFITVPAERHSLTKTMSERIAEQL